MALVFSSSACSTSSVDNSSSRDPNAGQSTNPTRMHESKDLKLPLDDFLLTPPEMQIISRARERLIVKCLQRFGVEYASETKGGWSEPSQNERRYGVADAEIAKRSGYHAPALEGVPTRKISSTTEALLNGDVETYKGKTVPPNGCLGEAQYKLHESATYKALEEARRFNLESYKKSRVDSAVRRVNEKWSDCMVRSGYEYPDPISAINDKEFKTSSPSRHEKEVAYADVMCKRKVNVIGVWASTESSYQKSMIRQHAKVLQNGQRLKRNTLRVAESVLSER